VEAASAGTTMMGQCKRWINGKPIPHLVLGAFRTIVANGKALDVSL
jgi:hypothetical protein